MKPVLHLRYDDALILRATSLLRVLAFLFLSLALFTEDNGANDDGRIRDLDNETLCHMNNVHYIVITMKMKSPEPAMSLARRTVQRASQCRSNQSTDPKKWHAHVQEMVDRDCCRN